MQFKKSIGLIASLCLLTACGGESNSSPTPPKIPVTPSKPVAPNSEIPPVEQLRSITITKSSITLGWQDKHQAERYFIYRDGKQVAEVEKGFFAYSDNNLTPNQSYRYDVVSVSKEGKTALARTITLTTLANDAPVIKALTAPVILMSQASTGTLVAKITATDANNDPISYRLSPTEANDFLRISEQGEITTTDKVASLAGKVLDVKIEASDSFSLATTELKIGFADEQNKGVLREVYTGDNMTGKVAALKTHPSFPHAPSSVTTETSFSSPRNTGNWYGQRMTAYIVPPVTGEYTFWIASDDDAELWLSDSTSEDKLNKIAYVPSYTGVGQWDKSPHQKSKTIELEAGKAYLLRAIMAEGSGADFVDVAWQRPNSAREIIGNTYLIYPADVSAPSPVNAFNWLKKTENSVLLEWQAATDNQGVDHYAIYNHGQFLQNTKTLSAELTQLQSDTQYNFTVKAVDKAGNISASSQTGIIVIDDIIAPSQPSQLTLKNSDHQSISVDWQASNDEKQTQVLYKVYLNDKQVGQTYNTHYTFEQLTPNTDYKVQLQAFDISGNSSALSPALNVKTTALIAGTPAFEHNHYTFAAASNSAVGSQLGLITFQATNPTQLRIIDGDPQGYFAINNQGQITLAKALPTNTSLQFPLTVQISDQQTGGKLFSQTKVQILSVAPVQLTQQGVLQQVWTGISGNAIADINTLAPIASQTVLQNFKSPADMGSSYGQRVSGYLRVPETGKYRFWIASDDASELRISPDSSADKAKPIARINGYTSIDNWYDGSQIVREIELTKGQFYYIEALHKEGGGGDHLSVAWQGPTISKQLLTGKYFTPASSLIPATAQIESGYQTGLSTQGNQITLDFVLDQSAVDGEVWVYYGEMDAGANENGWQYRIKLNDLKAGKNSVLLDRIRAGQQYYIRIETRGLAGSSWTAAPLVVDTVIIDSSKTAGEALPMRLSLKVVNKDQDFNIELEKHSVRSPNYQLLTFDDRRDQQFMPVTPMPEVRTYRGIVENDSSLTATAVVDAAGKLYLSVWGGDRLRWTKNINIKDRINPQALGNSEINNNEIIIDFTTPTVTNNRLYLPQPGVDFHNNLGRISFTHNNSQFVARAGSNIINAVAQMEGHINELDYTWAQKTGLRWDIGRALIEVHGESNNAVDKRPHARDDANFSIEFQDSRNGGYCWGGGDWVGCIANFRMNWGFTHEIGHNFGLGHGEQTDNNEQIQTPSTHMGNMQAWKTTQRLQANTKFKPTQALQNPMLPATFKDYITVYKNESGTINPLANDYDANGDALQILSFDSTTAKGGTVTRHNNTLSYVPPRDFTGVDQFTYTATDGKLQTTGPVQIQVLDASIAADWDMETVDVNTIKDSTQNQFDLTAPDLNKLTGKTINTALVADNNNGVAMSVPLIASTKMENDALGHKLLPHYLDPGHKSFTASMWFKMSKTSESKLLMGKSSSGPNNMQYGGWEVRSTDNGIEIEVRFRDRLMKNNKLMISQTATVDDEQWHHVVIVIDKENNKLQGYLDGNLFEGDLPQSSEPIMAAMNSSGYGGGSPFKLGGHTSVACAKDQTENCPITSGMAFDKVKVYHKALTQQEITTLFNDQ